MQEDVVLTLLQGDSRIKKVLDKLESEGFKWLNGDTPHEGYKSTEYEDINLYIHHSRDKIITYSDLNYIDTSFKDITIDEFLGISNLSFSSIITSTEPLYIEFKDRNKFKRFIMECYMREDDVFSDTSWSVVLDKFKLKLATPQQYGVYINPEKHYLDIVKVNSFTYGDDITYPSISKETINSIISPIIENGEVIRNYKEIVDVIAKLKEL